MLFVLDTPHFAMHIRAPTAVTIHHVHHLVAILTRQNINADQEPLSYARLPCLPTDVGGGSVLNTERSSLARIPLRWMIREVFRTNTGIRFDLRLLEDIGFNSASLWLHANPAGPNSDTPVPEVDGDEEHWDGLCPTYDQLRLKPWWWILEVVPSKQRDGKKWRKYT